MSKPSIEQIRDVANRLAANLRGTVHVHGSDVAIAVDTTYPGMTDDEYLETKQHCVSIADEIRGVGLAKLWGDR